MQACPFQPPERTLEPRPITRPASVLPWSEANMSGLTYSNAQLFAPTEESSDGWYEAIRASQFPRVCGRYLLLEDDLDTAGVGWTASMLSVILAFAVRDGRVLVEQPVNASWGHRTPEQKIRNKRGHGRKPRWCDRAGTGQSGSYEAPPLCTFQCSGSSLCAP